ncbi:MAG: NAD(P)/FAD-dependent oxidoreductase [Pseudomonadota bacterium]
MNTRADALIIGGGPAGTSTAVWLAEAGWRVTLVEQHRFPRQKVCGECLGAGSFPLLDALGVGSEVRQAAGAPLTRVGWMDATRRLTARMPQSLAPYAYGHALGRDVFDSILLARAQYAGVDIHQPARVVSVNGEPGDFHCDITIGPRSTAGLSAAVIIDAHGSWEHGPRRLVANAPRDPTERVAQASDLFGFKASFCNTSLSPGWLPVFALNGGYGGMVVANAGRTTLALCMRRDTLRRVRMRYPGVAAGVALEHHLRTSCQGVREALQNGQRQGAWLSIGPLQTGTRLTDTPGIYRVGNAAGEAHPLVGEGMTMALQSARALTRHLIEYAARKGDVRQHQAAARAYAHSWRQLFSSRLRVAGCYAQIAMQPALSEPVGKLLNHWPGLLTAAAAFAGKARRKEFA